MALHLVPYNNAMRLGQGFNSYTQQICVDDAVVVDNERAENILLNDGTTMRILAQSMAKGSAWTRQKEVVVEKRYPSIEGHSHYAQLQNGPEMQAESNKNSLAIGRINVQAEDGPETTKAAGDEGTPDTVAESAEHQAQTVTETTTAESTSEITELTPCASSDDGTCIVALTTDHKSADRHKPGPILAAPNTAIMVADDEDQITLRRMENERLREQHEYQKEIERELRAENQKCREEAREERRKIREETLQFERECRLELYRSINNATGAKSKALAMGEMLSILKQNKLPERLNGMGQNGHEYVFDANIMRGPSQTVTYTSRFVDRLSDITDDMCISGALSIKAAKIGGNGRGSFIDSDKFKESDLTFYISVKVVNQTINFKDALRWNEIPGVPKEDFVRVYGDTFVSGFLEGGEFNAVISMKILDKAMKIDIQNEAKIAFTAGPMGPEAESNAAIARSKIESNTETTIQVSWCGGGRIKPMEQQWDLSSLMQAATRFPDLVAECPQRTYAILTKYENLRSFITKHRPTYSKLQYENAQIYTNMLMESFMSYKTLYKQISDQIFQVRQNTMEIVPWEAKEGSNMSEKIDNVEKLSSPPPTVEVKSSNSKGKTKKDGFYPYIEDNSPFEATIDGLDQARRAIRRQMARIVNEVDAIEENPGIATDEDHCEPFQPPASFEMRIPAIITTEKTFTEKIPSTNRRILNLMRRQLRLVFRRKGRGEQTSHRGGSVI